MLQLTNIVKTYKTGDFTQDALKGVSISFRKNEFVSILGQSGSGKTTILNIIGGLDRYTKGDLKINGVSTKQYNDADWDHYRNNSIGFVFQSYNLIPHQSVLSNVEIALTLAGISKQERRERAIAVLNKVGLNDHIYKKPNQLSGGQMQRVAIARALVNNPDILLADEPTGALDSETSIQIMELLKEIAKDKLVIMVTHNPELAENYSTRIVRLLDGQIISDSNPFTDDTITKNKAPYKKISMSFITALQLSFNNLKTKKGRTLLTAFAGSIGIIGIALILALSTGMSSYITDIQRDTMTSYPITISDETIDVSGLIGMQGEIIGEMNDENEAENENREGVYIDYKALEANEKISSSIVENNLTEFKQYLDNPDSEIQQYIGENGIVYTYDVNFNVYSYDADGNLIDSDTQVEDTSSPTSNDMQNNFMRIFGESSGFSSGNSAGASNFSQLMEGNNGEAVSHIVTDSYDVLYGNWPKEYNEVVLVVNDDNGISAEILYQLGFITKEQYNNAITAIENESEPEEIRFEYADLCNHTFYLVAACDHYVENDDGTFSRIDNIMLNEDILLSNSVELKITGVIRPKDDAQNANISTSVAYTSKLTDYIISHTNESAVVTAQEADTTVNVLNGMEFEAASDDEKIEDTKEYLNGLSISEKASFYTLIMYYASSDEGTESYNNYAGMMDESSMALALEQWLAYNPDNEILLRIYDEYIAGASFEDNMKDFGKVSYEAPSTISIYTDSFENKDAIAECIARYNETASEDARITYTDYVAMLTSSITTIINGISYVLIAFVAISLVVSCIMIGIITHISVMERTKEIGILRSLGASKSNISQVFNAETFIIGCCSGILGIIVSLIAILPINAIIASLTGINDLKAQLPLYSALILIVISIVITMIGGLLPAKSAAKKDPVIALRTE